MNLPGGVTCLLKPDGEAVLGWSWGGPGNPGSPGYLGRTAAAPRASGSSQQRQREGRNLRIEHINISISIDHVNISVDHVDVAIVILKVYIRDVVDPSGPGEVELLVSVRFDPSRVLVGFVEIRPFDEARVPVLAVLVDARIHPARHFQSRVPLQVEGDLEEC